jgi:energy-coupling factor transporter ATP-binding protein EcfA2
MTSINIADEYAFRMRTTRNETFLQEEGFGPFVVQRDALIQDILGRANPRSSVHINGCKGSGKTTVLKQIGQALQSQGKTGLFFESAEGFNGESVSFFVRGLVRSTQEVYILVDETQSNFNSELFTLLLKNPEGHRVTTIGAGVPEFQSVSAKFKHKIGTDCLFLHSFQLHQTEGVIEYFERHATETAAAEIEILLEHIRSHVVGHIYPLCGWQSDLFLESHEMGRRRTK